MIAECSDIGIVELAKGRHVGEKTHGLRNRAEICTIFRQSIGKVGDGLCGLRRHAVDGDFGSVY